MNTMIEMYDRIMSVVEEVTGISKDKILTSNCEECVDARHILVYILGNRSFSDNKIAELTGLTRPGVCIIRNNFKYRRKRYFVNLNYERVYAKVFDSNVFNYYYTKSYGKIYQAEDDTTSSSESDKLP